jgi:alpha-L-fucosidase
MKWSRVLSLCVFAHKYSVAEGALSIPINLSTFFNGKAASTGPGDHLANFDGSGRAYPVQFLPKGGSNFSYEGIDFLIPPFDSPTTFDFIRSNSQVIEVTGTDGATAVKYQSFHALAAAVWTSSGFAQGRNGSRNYHPSIRN